MNYEELLASRNGATMKRDNMPFGSFYKKMTDGTYHNVMDLRQELADSLRFCEALKAESQLVSTVSDRHQLRFAVTTDSSGLLGVTLEQGNFSTLAHMLEENPAIVAEKNFVESLIKSLVEITTSLNGKGIYHLCFAPSNILMRKGSSEPLLLFHGSSYMLLNDQEQLYGSSSEFVAPEVLEDSSADERSEVYSLGKLMEFLYRDSSVPLEFRAIIKKALQVKPEKRYKTPAEMLQAMQSRRYTRTSITMGLLALLITVVGVGIYFEMVPNESTVEFVDPVPKEEFTDELGTLPAEPDSAYDLPLPSDSGVSRVDEQQMKEFQAKAEQIFRKRYAKEADRILSRIYDNEHMNSSEKKFLSESSNVTTELAKKQIELGSEAGLSDIQSQRIASEIIERLSNEKKAKLEQYGIQKKQSKDNEE